MDKTLSCWVQIYKYLFLSLGGYWGERGWS